MNRRAIWCCCLFVLGCQSSTPTATPIASSNAAAAGGELAPASGSVGNARSLSRGGSFAMTVGCRAHFYVGPFRFNASGESALIHSSTRSVSGAQACGLLAAWVSGEDREVAVAGVGCPEGAAPAEMDITYEYSPANGGNDVNPVYLRFHREDPADCAPLALTLTLR